MTEMKKNRKKTKKSIRLIWIVLPVLIVIVAMIGYTGYKNEKEQKQEQLQNQLKNQTQDEAQEQKFVQMLEDGTKLNVSEKVQETKEVEDIEISNIQITYKDGVTNILATIENKTDRNLELQNLSIDLLDDEGNTIYTFTGVLENTQARGTSQLNTSITADFSNCYDLKIRKEK